MPAHLLHADARARRLENVLIDADGYVKICDFGFAKKAAASRTFTKCGTDE